MSTYTYSYAYTRAQALVDQVDVLFTAAGIDQGATAKVCFGVNQKWLTAVGLYLSRDGNRVYEVEARINWAAHSDRATLDFSTDLPGWDGTASPEASILGARFAARARDQGLAPHYWVRFTTEITADPARHSELCPKVGVSYGSHPPEWRKSPSESTIRLQDLGEVGLSERSAL
ncbi:hypothetical protein RN607_03855 [Demequina capsici]|uniref:Uncharacterized protein n=1 Tax=Demequina capsici TaxID=3075620 RepID=A0AA96FDV6_9MICO|nr:hypothetical protein [Demequina sp. PMTSA13]WNM28148.1 hypothetical protein RN607_03855 [Demequina sp. PMTSA13]